MAGVESYKNLVARVCGCVQAACHWQRSVV